MREEENGGLGPMYAYGGGGSGSFIGKSDAGRGKPSGSRYQSFDSEDEEEGDGEEGEEEEQPVVEKLLMSGDSLLVAENQPTNIQLKNPEGATVTLTSLLKPPAAAATATAGAAAPPPPQAATRREVVILFVDPRRLNEDFKTVLRQLERIPARSLVEGGVVRMAAISSDDSAELRRFLKKFSKASVAGAGQVAVYSDSSKKVRIH